MSRRIKRAAPVELASPVIGASASNLRARVITGEMMMNNYPRDRAEKVAREDREFDGSLPADFSKRLSCRSRTRTVVFCIALDRVSRLKWPANKNDTVQKQFLCRFDRASP